MTPLKRDLRFTVDLDEEKGVQSKANRENKHNITINYAVGGGKKDGVINMAALQGYLEGKMSFDNSVLEAISA